MSIDRNRHLFQESSLRREQEQMDYKVKKETKSIELTIFLMSVLGLWPTSTSREQLRANFALGLMILSMSTASLCEAQDLFFSRKDILVVYNSKTKNKNAIKKKVKILTVNNL